MALTLTEQLIRNRVNLTHENLEDIKSLSLPGTFHEKIVSIGTSLRKFSRLKSLDFSRNALESLQGLDHLQVLEKLNLYYNNVSTLEELTRLKHNQNLKELDLRLNPVTRNEPDYRLYLIHMLPNLQKLDDRGVRDRERQAALVHFSSSQAAEMTPKPTQPPNVSKSPHPRTEMMSKLMKGPSVLVDDDVAVIDVMNRNNGDFGAPRPLTGSAAKEDAVEDYTLDSLKFLNAPKSPKHRDRPMDDAPIKSQAANKIAPAPKSSALSKAEELYPHIMAAPSDNVQRIGDGSRKDPNLLFSDQVEAHSKYRGQGFFTPHPDGPTVNSQDSRSLPPDVQGSLLQTDCEGERMTSGKPGHRRSNSVPNRQVLRGEGHTDMDIAHKKFLNSLLNLVDRYWNGSQSLHNHTKFVEQAGRLLNDFVSAEGGKEEETRTLRQTIGKLKEENATLRANQTAELLSPSEEEMKISLKRAKDDMARMHEEIRHYLHENRALQKRLDSLESAAPVSRYHSGAAASETSTANQSVLDDLHRQNVALNQEIDLMRTKLKQFSQVQELASMLQESHKSLVETNDHLLKELQETKHKHHKEIEQMHWSYDQLKSTLAYSSVSRSHNFSGSGNTNNSQSLSNHYSDSLDMKDS
ncbi:centrosomal protein of 72 kDa [Aplysia californica]|uniref:Centrosomal protein of 72 kDa n=1 Tax=Aplysia californica TaxID=6500 RepID=A0ABM1ADS8_APLCA|nr:centrosomal protein of 72 kDa [Aplysia californica]